MNPVVVVVAVEASAQKTYPRVTLACASTLSGSVVRTLRGGEGLPTMFCLVVSSRVNLCSRCSIIYGSSFQRGHRGSAEDSASEYAMSFETERVLVCDCYDNCSHRCG